MSESSEEDGSPRPEADNTHTGDIAENQEIAIGFDARVTMVEGDMVHGDKVMRDKIVIEHLEMPALRHFTTLEEYLTRPGPRFPKERDFEEDLVYLPEEYASTINQLLEEAGRCLLVGRSAAGKTVLAIALARQLRDTQGYEIFYGDAVRAEEGDGRAWYQAMCANDREGALYILDNCHLATEEVNEFCFQWEGAPPKQARTILISRPRTRGLEVQSSEIGDYFDMSAEATVEVQPEAIYRGVIEKCATAYRRRDPSFYVATENDNESLLQAQHAHNLAASRSRLETWRENGGRLSDITQEAVHIALDRKYLSHAREILAALCALWQYEIPAHNVFVERTLSNDEVRQLEEQCLLDHMMVQDYGVVYQPVFHAEEAREIFKASIYRRYGRVEAGQVETETTHWLQIYLRTKPPNYQRVYQRLYKEEQLSILHQLLADRDLQACAASQFEHGRVLDTALYLYGLSQIDLSRARQILSGFATSIGANGIRLRVLQRSLSEVGLSLHYISKLDPELAREILTAIDPRQLAVKAQGSSVSTLSNLLNLARRLSSLTLMKPLVEAIDVEQLAQRVETQSLQKIYWLARALIAVSPGQASRLLGSIPAQTLVAKATKSDFSPIHKLLACLQELNYPTARLKAFVEAIDVEQLAQRVETQSLQNLFWLIRDLRDVSPGAANNLLEAITPDGLASLCRSREANVQNVQDFCKVSTRNFRLRFLRQFSAQDIATIFARSPLGQVGIFLEHRYRYLENGYALFKKQSLKQKLATEALDEISKFIRRIGRAPEIGRELACEVLDLLITVDLSERIASAGLESFTALLYNANAVDEAYPAHLLTPLARYEVLIAALERSGVRSIGFLIHDVANTDAQYLPYIRQALLASDLTEKLANSDVGDLGHFVWNVFAHVDQGLSRDYCRIIDEQHRSQQLSEASFDDLCYFLWNLTHISDLARLKTLDDPIVEERLVVAWSSEVGLGANLLGIVATTRPEIGDHVPLSPIRHHTEKENVIGRLEQIIKEQHPYTLALTLRGLRTHDESAAQALLREWLSIPTARQLLEDAAVLAVTPRSVELLQESLEWLANLPTNSSTDEVESIS